MDDEGAAVEKFVQCAQVAGEAWRLGEVVWGEAVGVGGAWVGAGVDHGVEVFADAAGGVEGDCVDGEQACGGRVDAGCLHEYCDEGVVTHCSEGTTAR